MKYGFYFVAWILILIFITLFIKYTVREERHELTEKGVDCVVDVWGQPKSCNWDAWNLKTNYGMFPEKAFDP